MYMNICANLYIQCIYIIYVCNIFYLLFVENKIKINKKTEKEKKKNKSKAMRKRDCE
ncbi:hypothetical protein [Plasmodium yoelii yoelii]|uniref:Uncharacterized protein n=1 Tax=Plasmodium yoelii yoelii TaxID=73239 RepID=Q7REY8_PLAYO|nr:hypothetical protein [Plasmodium yoelii yoelii]